MTTAQLVAVLIVFGVPSIALIADALDARRLQRRAEQRRSELAGSSETQTPHISPPLGHSRQDLFNADHPGRVRLGLNERARRR